MTGLLEISNLTAGYGKARVLRDVSLTVAPGESVALIGRNGAGKSTLLLSLFGLAQVHSGRVTVAGRPVETSRRTRLAAHGLALTPQGRRIITQLTVEENLILGTAAGRSGHWDLDAVYRLFPVLAERARRPGSALSGGQQQMLAIGRALMANPDLLFLDEPSEGLAPVIIDGLVDVFRAIQSAGTAIFIVEQHLNLVRKVADRVLVLSKGELIAEAPIDRLDTPEFQQSISL
jgi:branched-chain amino acid transport system ATP-binding protein